MDANVHVMRRPKRGNETLSVPLDEREKEAMIASATAKLEELFDVLAIDHQNDHNTVGTPHRVASMLVEELLDGRFSAPPRITEFENILGYDDLIVTGPIDLRSTCAHHLMPIVGHAYIGIVPSKEGRIIGLSKYDRIVSYFASRLQIQEELVKQIGDYINDVTQPMGLAVRISAVHMCKTHRGVRATHRSRMVSSAYHGSMQTDAALKQRFLQECLGLERGLDL
jgi:GTP cyclohydrolase IA